MDTDRARALPDFKTRRDGRGYVVFVPSNGKYLYVDEAGKRLLDMLCHEPAGHEARRLAAELSQAGAEETDVLLNDVVAALQTGEPSELATKVVTTLSEATGSDMDRCQTFGMPL